jgi:hypothetical protein
MAGMALLFLTTMQPAPFRVMCRTPFVMASMGELRNDIEYTRRLLRENEILVHISVKRMVRVGLSTGKSVKDYAHAKRVWLNLENRNVVLHEEMQKLIVNSIRVQMRDI